jgi:demethylmenaquinone methyltransferase/2-methoxy-6-polyprenyl-1,4-benzoquinol methylase
VPASSIIAAVSKPEPNHENAGEASGPLWRNADLADPHATPDKAVRVRRMFGNIADSYDLNNRLHSLGRDQAWRRRAVELCRVKSTDIVLDVACGTGDLTLAFAGARPKRAIGLDFAHPMLRIADRKRAEAGLPAASSEDRPDGSARRTPVHFGGGDALRLPLADRSVDVVSIAFGIRNVADPAAAIREFHRVLRPGGRVCILEFSVPGQPLLHKLYQFYFNHVMPRTASWISRDRTGAYRYLPESVNTFLGREEMAELMRRAGFLAITQTPMTFGIAVAYLGRRN